MFLFYIHRKFRLAGFGFRMSTAKQVVKKFYSFTLFHGDFFFEGFFYGTLSLTLFGFPLHFLCEQRHFTYGIAYL